MAIDYVVHYPCIPKETLTTEGILERLKARERAAQIIRLYRENGDERPLSEMGFEFTRTTAEGESVAEIILVQDLVDRAAELDPLAHHCAGCPANLRAEPFGCAGFIQYPISSLAEAWLLDRLPGIEQPLIWLLLRQGVQQMGYDGASVRPLRANPTYFEERQIRGRDLIEFVISADQVFEMIFLLGPIQPAHAGILLLFFDAVPRETIEADQITAIMNGTLDGATIERDFPFTLEHYADEDQTIAELKDFFRALHRAWSLNVALLLDV